MLDPHSRPRRQRALVLAAVFALALAGSLGLGLDKKGPAARAALPDSPFVCGAGDANRQPMKMWAGDMGADGSLGNMTPCLSGVKMTLNIPRQSGAATVSKLRKLDAQNDVTIKTANGTVPNIFHVAFKGFTINSSARNVTLKSNGGTSLTTPHSLTLAPDAGAVFGGGDVITDLLVTGTSKIVIDPMPVAFFNTCGLLGGGPAFSSTCTVLVKDISPNMVEFANAIGISTLTITEMNLDIYYLVTHTTTGGIPAGASVQLPNTRMTVGN